MAVERLSLKKDIVCFNADEFLSNTTTRYKLDSTSTSFVGYAGAGLPDEAGIGVIIPDNYKSDAEFALVYTMDGTGTGTDNARFALNLTQVSATNNKVLSNVDETLAIIVGDWSTAAWQGRISSYVASALNLSPGDWIHIEIERDPGHASDTSGDIFYLTALLFKYTAK